MQPGPERHKQEIIVMNKPVLAQPEQNFGSGYAKMKKNHLE